jgi:oligoendopeptidase F
MPLAVYRTLVDEAHAVLPSLHRYLRLRKRLLRINGPLRYYDNYPPLFALQPLPHFTVADSERITLKALQPLGEDYLNLLRRGFAGRWMNVYPRPGKASGGYMAGSAYDVHPYLLLNHNDDYEALTTIAHEWGHAVHTLLTHDAQPFEKSELLDLHRRIGFHRQRDAADRLHGGACGVESGTALLPWRGPGPDSHEFFRQVLFAEFELQIHEEQEAGHALSGARMSAMYCGLLRRYYGEADGVMKIDPAYCSEWALISQFYQVFLCISVCNVDGGCGLHDRRHPEGRRARVRPVPHDAASRRFGLPVRDLPTRRHRHGNAGALPGAESRA